MELWQLKPAPGSRHKKKRVGFGESSGHGKTSSRGGKGQTARTGGGVRAGFEGGQMPLYRRLPKFGFTSQAKIKGKNIYTVINVSILDRFPDGTTVDKDSLRTLGIKHKAGNMAGIKVLGGGKLSKKLKVRVQAVSENARRAIEACGGLVELISGSSTSKSSSHPQ